MVGGGAVGEEADAFFAGEVFDPRCMEVRRAYGKDNTHTHTHSLSLYTTTHAHIHRFVSLMHCAAAG